MPRRGGVPNLLSIVAVSSLGACAVLPPRSDDPVPVVRGPVGARLQHPLALTTLALRPRRPVTEPPGSTTVGWSSHYSSIFQNEASVRDDVLLDGELWTNALRVRYGLTENTDIEVELGTLYTTSGFLDELVDEFHDAFGLPDGNRSSLPQDRWGMRLIHDGETAYELEEDRFGLLDLPVVWTWAVARERDGIPGVAVRVAVELPVGSESDGFSNGEVDWGAGVILERSLGRWTLSGGTHWVDPGRSDGFRGARVDAASFWNAQAGVEYRWSDELSLLAQLVYTSPLVRDIELEEIDSPILDLGLGMAWDTEDASRLTLTFHEDVFSDAGPDFGLALAWSRRLGRGGADVR